MWIYTAAVDGLRTLVDAQGPGRIYITTNDDHFSLYLNETFLVQFNDIDGARKAIDIVAFKFNAVDMKHVHHTIIEAASTDY